MKYFLAVFVICLCLFKNGLCNTDTKYADTENSTLVSVNTSESSRNFKPSFNPFKSNPIRQKWKNTTNMLEQMSSTMVKELLPFIVKASEELNVSSKCSQHLMMTLRGIKQMKLWAFRMLDSSGKLPVGMLWGTTTSYGNFDECLSIDVKEHFRGRYCTIGLKLPMPKRIPFSNNFVPNPELQNLSSSDTVMGFMVEISQFFHHGEFRTSICVPSSCSRRDVENICRKVIEMSGTEFEIEVPNCETKETLPFSWVEIFAMSMLSAVLSIAAAGTITDVVINWFPRKRISPDTSGLGVKILLCFSVYNNTKKLLKNDNVRESITIFRGMRALTMLWIIFGHTCVLPNISLTSDSLWRVREIVEDIAFQVVLNGSLSVETFFFMSAVLLIYARMKINDKYFKFGFYVFRRTWRLTPPIVFLILCTLLAPRLGSGPIWKEVVGKEAEACKHYWWKNILFINNFGPLEKMCVPWLWYIAVDTQLYMLAFLVALPIKHYPRIGFPVIVAIFIGGMLWMVSTNLAHNLYPVLLPISANPDDARYFFRYGYFKAFHHTSSYCVGMVIGYLLATRPKMKISSFVNVSGWFLSILVGLIILYGTYDWHQGNVPTMAVATLYACVCKGIYAMCLAWVTISCFTGNGGIISSVLGWSAFIPFSRLTYAAYLVHPMIQYMYYGSMKTLLQYGYRTLVYVYFGHVVMVFMVAYAFSMLFESPFMALEKIIISSLKPEEKEDKVTDTSN